MSMKKMFRSINRELKRRVAKDWERHAADFVPKRILLMRREILDASTHGLAYAKEILDMHVKGLQGSEKGPGKGFTQEQTDAMIQNLQSFFKELEKKAKKGP